MGMMMVAAKEGARNTCQRIDLNIRRKAPTIKEETPKATSTQRVAKAKKEGIKKAVAKLTHRNMAWESPKIRVLLMSLTSSHISKISNRWTNLKSKNYLLTCSLCMVTISQASAELKIQAGHKMPRTQSMAYSK